MQKRHLLEEGELPRFNPEQHIVFADAKFIKRDAKVGDELVFPLEVKEDYGRIAAQTAKQVIIQKIREAEKVSVVAEYGKRQGRSSAAPSSAWSAAICTSTSAVPPVFALRRTNPRRALSPRRARTRRCSTK